MITFTGKATADGYLDCYPFGRFDEEGRIRIIVRVDDTSKIVARRLHYEIVEYCQRNGGQW